MIRRTSAAALFVLGVLALGGCKDKEPEPQAVPVPTGTPAAVTADPTAAAPTMPTTDMPAGDAMDGGADASAAAVAPTTPPPAGASDPAPPKTGGSIDACCSALAAQRSTKNLSLKSKIDAAYSVCGGIAKRVKAGETSRSAALTQIRSALTGATVPAECR